MRVSRPQKSAHMGRMDLHCRSLLPAGLRCFKVDARQGSHGGGVGPQGFRLYMGGYVGIMKKKMETTV